MIACNERKQAFNFAGGTRVNPAVPWDYTPLRALVSLHGTEAGQVCPYAKVCKTTAGARHGAAQSRVAPLSRMSSPLDPSLRRVVPQRTPRPRDSTSRWNIGWGGGENGKENGVWR
ncbi:hypothetical protein B0H10DRAFT_1959861 [Mycena sp. CBHHK59/15]|nr:hypothetical protein B0H10DRAFT_1959861 [Mycena sp. CBHHK59/15]